MPLSPKQFNERKEKAKRNADIKAVIDSTGAKLASSNADKGEYMYHAPYREDTNPSLKINVRLQKFIDFGQNGAEGDVIELIRLIFGRGDASAFPFFDALKWLEQFSGISAAPKAIQPRQRSENRPAEASPEPERFSFVKATPVSAKTHHSNLAYIEEIRKIGRPIASRYLEVIQYRDHAAAFDDPLRGNRYGIGGRNDSGGYEVRAAMANSNFKTSLGPKDVSSFDGHPTATTGHIFEGRFDFLTRLQIAGETHNYNPTIVLNSGRLAARGAHVIKNRWSHVKHWHIWQHNDDEGDRTTQVLIEELGDGYTVGTVNHLYDGFNDLNECWTDAAPDRRATLTAQILTTVRPLETPESRNTAPASAYKPKGLN